MFELLHNYVCKERVMKMIFFVLQCLSWHGPHVTWMLTLTLGLALVQMTVHASFPILNLT